MVCKVLQPPSVAGILRNEKPTALYLQAWLNSLMAYFLILMTFLGDKLCLCNSPSFFQEKQHDSGYVQGLRDKQNLFHFEA